ncbi:MAG: helix-hairpin-helix domain-containing protein [Burkholderiaceae bacterium]|nr:MAG: helix-hairpin-helix domain-containing protein [Burkholderiaceae bacterium]
MLKKILAILAMLYAMSAFAAVDVNKASAADLDSVKGIGPAISAKIVEERKKGEFKDWNDLVSRVKGIGETSAAKLSEAGLTVNGAAYPGAPAKAAPAKAEKRRRRRPKPRPPPGVRAQGGREGRRQGQGRRGEEGQGRGQGEGR